MNDFIAIFGDVCPDNNFRFLFDNQQTGAFSVEIARLIRQSSLSVCNLECPATYCSQAAIKTGPSLKAKPKDISLLKAIGFDVFSLANNHILDYGTQGLNDTLIACDKEGIQTVGAGKDAEDAARPLVVTIGDKNIGFASFAEAEFNLACPDSPGANHFDPYLSYDHVRDLKKDCDYVVVLYHGGIEHYKYPSPLLQKKCRCFVNAGANLVICQHSHCIGTLEEIDGSTIIYGQGNSLFGYREGENAWNEGLVVIVREDGIVELLLLKATWDGVFIAPEVERQARLEEMWCDSEQIGDNAWLTARWEEYAKTQESLDLPLLFCWSRVANKLNRILKNKLITTRYSKRKLMVAMNLLRCEAHHEVVQTILESEVLRKRSEQ